MLFLWLLILLLYLLKYTVHLIHTSLFFQQFFLGRVVLHILLVRVGFACVLMFFLLLLEHIGLISHILALCMVFVHWLVLAVADIVTLLVISSHIFSL